MLNINANRSAVGFGKVVEVKKVIVDGQQTAVDWHINTSVHSVNALLLKKRAFENEYGQKIREKFAENVDDYIIPEQNASTPDKSIFSYVKINNKYFIGTGEEAKLINKAGFTRMSIHDNQDFERIDDKKAKKQRDDLDSFLLSEFNNPKNQLNDNKKLVIYAQTMPESDDFLRTLRGRNDTIQVTGIDFTV